MAMPLYFNVKSHVLRIKLADGRSFGFPPRQDVFIAKSDLSADVQLLLNNKSIVYRGHTSQEQAISSDQVDLRVIQEAGKRLPEPPATSSNLQPEYDNKIDSKDEAMLLDETDDLDMSIDDSPKRRGRKKLVKE